jgi:hypothetical protein
VHETASKSHRYLHQRYCRKSYGNCPVALFFVKDEGGIKVLHVFSDILMNGGLVPYGNKDIVYRNMSYKL